MINCYLQTVLAREGQLFLDAEAALIAQGGEAVPFLQEELKKSDSFNKLVIGVILERIAGNQVFQAVLDFFDQTERVTASTVKGAPSPEWVAARLFQDFGSRAAPLLGVYLNKLASLWPNWKIMGVILYLGKLTSAASADVLIKFVTVTPSEHYRKFALQSLVAVGDAGALSKIGAELELKDAARNILQQAADQIRDKLKMQP